MITEISIMNIPINYISIRKPACSLQSVMKKKIEVIGKTKLHHFDTFLAVEINNLNSMC